MLICPSYPDLWEPPSDRFFPLCELGTDKCGKKNPSIPDSFYSAGVLVATRVRMDFFFFEVSVHYSFFMPVCVPA